MRRLLYPLIFHHSTFRFLIAFIFFSLLLGCSTIAPHSEAPNKKLSWDERKVRLNAQHHWQLNGKIAVQTARESGSATVDWIQNNDHYTISLLGPMGTNGMKLIGQPGEVRLMTADGKQMKASSPEVLLAKQWGFHVPITHLNYWVRGLPVPRIPAHPQFDSFHRLASLTQNGWKIQFMSYINTKNIDLPNKILISSPALKSKIMIYHWKE